MSDNAMNFVIGWVLGWVLGMILMGLVMSETQFVYTLDELKPFLQLKCETPYKDMTDEQIKFCKYFKKDN